MGREELTPSESEWQVMEVLWESREALTSSEVIEHIRPKGSMNPKMVRVLMNRLCQKGILAYRVDGKDARIYHYYHLKTRKELKKPQTKIVINKNNLSTEEAKLIENYRNLTPDQKIIIDNSLQTFNQNNSSSTKSH